jgi:fibronectin-binding autotransporter adhesin
MLLLGNGGDASGIVSNVIGNGTLASDRGGVATFPGVISRTGGLDQIGLGTTILTADDTHSGATNVRACPETSDGLC